MTQNTLKRSAYAAIGIPVDIANKLKERIEATRETLDEARDRISDQTRSTIDEWAREGEKIVTSLTDRAADARKSADDIRRTASERVEVAETKMTDVAEGLAAAATKPFAPLDSVDGIGPAYAKKLKKAGIVSTAALVERTSDSAEIDRLADQTNLPATSLRAWAADADLTRIKGIGQEFMGLLNAARVGSISQLAQAKADELRSEIVSVHAQSGMADTLPSQETIASWITTAKRMS